MINSIILCALFFGTLWLERPARTLWGGQWGLALFAAWLLWIALSILPGLGAIVPAPSAWSPSLNSISVAPVDSLQTLLQVFGYGLLFMLAYRAASGAKTRALLVLILVVIALHAFYGLVLLGLDQQLFFLKSVQAYEGSATGGFVNRNSFATFLGLGLTIGAGLIYEQVIALSNRRAASVSLPLLLVNILCQAVCVTALLASESRMGLAAALSGMSAIIVIQSLSHRVIRLGLVSFGLLGVASVALIWFFGTGLLQRALTTDLAFGLRLQAYEEAFALFLQRPFTGFGAGSFEVAFSVFKSDPALFSHLWNKAHNSYLTLLAEQGLVGFALLMGLFVWLIGLQLRKLRLGATFSASVALCCTIVIAVHSLIDFSMEIYAVAFFYVLIMGACTAAPVQHKRQRDQ